MFIVFASKWDEFHWIYIIFYFKVFDMMLFPIYKCDSNSHYSNEDFYSRAFYFNEKKKMRTRVASTDNCNNRFKFISR